MPILRFFGLDTLVMFKTWTRNVTNTFAKIFKANNLNMYIYPFFMYLFLDQKFYVLL